jgi:hypothetical protein
MNFLQNFLTWTLIGTIASINIALNIRFQDRYKRDPNSYNNWMQGLVYIGTLVVGAPSIIFICVTFSDFSKSSPLEVAAFLMSGLLPFIITFRYLGRSRKEREKTTSNKSKE